MLRSTKTTLMIGLTVAAAAAPWHSSQAADPAGWQFEVAPYIWGAGLSGDATVDDIPATFDLPFTDVLEILGGAGFLHFEGNSGAWGFLVDGMYVRLEDESESASIASFDTTTETMIGEAAGVRRFNMGTNSIDLIFGARGVNFDTEIEVVDSQNLALQGRSAEGDRGWVDAMVGTRFNLALSKSWSFSMRLDFSSGGSELTWGLAAMARWQMSPHVALPFGFKMLDIDYEDEADDLEFDMQFAGLAVGLAFTL